MPNSDWSESTVLAEWAEEETLHLDLISSWETLVSVYDTLRFTGPENDELRLAEFKLIITEMNKFLTRMKTGLTKTTSIEDAIEFLEAHVNLVNMADVRNRPNIAYNKLKQRWIARSMAILTAAQEKLATDEGERDAD